MHKISVGDIIRLDALSIFFMDGINTSSFWNGTPGIVFDIYDNKLSVIDSNLKVIGPVSNKRIEIISARD